MTTSPVGAWAKTPVVNTRNTAAIQMEESTAEKRMGNDLLVLMVILMVGTCCSAAD
jgi:hypothetical protein